MARGRPRKRKPTERGPKIKAGVPSCPDGLSTEAQEKWKGLLSELQAMGVLATADADTMARYCEAWASWKRANAKIIEKGEVYTGPQGGLVQNPYMSIRNKASNEMHKIAVQLGLDPLSRQRLHVAAEEPDTSKDRFFR